MLEHELRSQFNMLKYKNTKFNKLTHGIHVKFNMMKRKVTFSRIEIHRRRNFNLYKNECPVENCNFVSRGIRKVSFERKLSNSSGLSNYETSISRRKNSSRRQFKCKTWSALFPTFLLGVRVEAYSTSRWESCKFTHKAEFNSHHPEDNKHCIS